MIQAPSELPRPLLSPAAATTVAFSPRPVVRAGAPPPAGRAGRLGLAVCSPDPPERRRSTHSAPAGRRVVRERAPAPRPAGLPPLGPGRTAQVSVSFDAIRTGKGVPAQLVSVSARTGRPARSSGASASTSPSRPCGHLGVVLHGRADAQKPRAPFRSRIKIADLAEQSRRDRRGGRLRAERARVGAAQRAHDVPALAGLREEMKLPRRRPHRHRQADHPAVPHLGGPPVEGLEITTNSTRATASQCSCSSAPPRARVAVGEHALEWAFELIGATGGQRPRAPAAGDDADDRHPDRQPRRVQRLARGRRAPGRRRRPQRRRDRNIWPPTSTGARTPPAR